MRARLRAVAAALAPAAVIVWVASLGGRLHWTVDLLSHFRPHAVGASLLGALVLFRLHRRRSALVAMAATVGVGATLIPYLPSGAPPPLGPSVRLLSANLLGGNRNVDAITRLLDEEQPDIVVFSEVTEFWLDAFSRWSSRYPYSVAEPRSDLFGIALLSRWPLAYQELMHLGDEGLPVVVARVDLGNRAVTVLGTHVEPPLGGRASRERNTHLMLLGQALGRMEGPVVLAGDLNTTPWSFTFRELLRNGGLMDSRRGRGILPTWPSWLLPLGIPIDHVLPGGGARVSGLRRLGPIGSDHRPLMAELEVTAGQ